MAKLIWEKVGLEGELPKDGRVFRAKVPAGWLLLVWEGDGKIGSLRGDNVAGLTFYPDPKHEWE